VAGILLAAGIIAVSIAVIALLAIRWALVHPRQSAARQDAPCDEHAGLLAARLRRHIVAIASQPHNVDHPEALEQAAGHIEAELIAMGHEPQRHLYACHSITVRNIEVVLAPPDASAATPTLVVGAHYDAPDDSPGANDNGTGVAALLELARLLKDRPVGQRVRLVFFVNEELPWGKTELMGSWRHAKSLREAGERVTGMIALETLGYFSEREGSQSFPFPLGALYGTRGNFVAFVGMLGGRNFVHAAVACFRQVSTVPSIGGVAPRAIEGIDLSDHWAYDQMGFPACMVTDTAPFRNPYYHQRFDTPDTVDYPMLARITLGLAATIQALAARK
jgi:hypothetical protein